MNDRSLRFNLISALAALVLASSWGGALAVESEARGAFCAKGLLNTDRGATVLDSRLDAEVDIGILTLGCAWRLYDLSDDAYNPAGIEVPQPDIKHRYAEVKGYGLFARGGHFFSTFGRGLVLRSFEEVGLEHDTALDGAMAEYARGPWKVTGLAGDLTERLSERQRRDHDVYGARVAAMVGGNLSIAACGVERRTRKRDLDVALPDSLSTFDDRVVGSEVEVWLGAVSLAAEYARRTGDYYPTSERGETEGHGFYLSGTASLPWLTVVAEYKDYERFDNLLANPPTCVKEQLWTLMNRATHEIDLNDEKGFLVEGTLTAFENTDVSGGASEARDDEGGLLHWEMFGQVERPNAGWGRGALGTSWSREYVEGKFTEYMTAALDVDLKVDGSPAVELGLEAQRTEEPSGEVFEDYLGSAAWYATPVVTLAASAETTTRDAEKRDLWLFCEARLLLGEDSEGSIGFGTERGGKKCSGGVCYTEPEFAGVRIRVSKSF